MVQLLLSEPSWNDDEDFIALKERISCLKRLEPIICSLITSEGRSEARLWFCKTVACLSSISPQAQRDSFLELLRSKPRNLVLCAQILRMIFEKRPHKVGPIIAKKPYILEKFFKGNPRRILQWFDNFAGVGESEHKNGARAISQFAFVNRDICWEKLEWRGKHGQSPAVVATKPLYFLDLDVQRTVENFLENVPEFWSSNELADSVKDGEIFLTDTEFFIDCFIDLMFEEDSKEVWKVIHEFLIEETFTVLCHHLLPIIEERDLRNFLDSLWKFHSVRMESKFFGHPSFWLQILLFVYNSFVSIDELLLLNAVINQGRQVLRLVRDKEHREQKRKIENLVLEMRTSSGISDALLIKECLNMDQAEAMKLLGLQSWVLHYRLSEECKTPDSWEALFTESKISFSKSNEYDLVSVDGFSEESQPDSGDDVSIGVKKKRKAKNRKKRRRRNRGHDNQNENELLDLGGSSAWHGLQSRTGSWMLSTDDYTSSWNSVDLPEHLSQHCLSTWLKWVWCKWKSFA